MPPVRAQVPEHAVAVGSPDEGPRRGLQPGADGPAHATAAPRARRAVRRGAGAQDVPGVPPPPAQRDQPAAAPHPGAQRPGEAADG